MCIYVTYRFCVEADFEDIVDLVPDHLNKVNITK